MLSVVSSEAGITVIVGGACLAVVEAWLTQLIPILEIILLALAEIARPHGAEQGAVAVGALGDVGAGLAVVETSQALLIGLVVVIPVLTQALAGHILSDSEQRIVALGALSIGAATALGTAVVAGSAHDVVSLGVELAPACADIVDQLPIVGG